MNQTDLVQLLRNKDAYPHKVTRIAVEETHISWVFLTGPYAYKIKKELRFGDILNFSTLQLRKKFCHIEIDINKPLCGSMYQGVVKIVKQKGEVKIVPLNHRAQALEYAVKMKEIPQKFRMDNLLYNNKVDQKMIEKLASILARFHRSTPTNNRIKSFGRPEFMKSKVQENFATLSKLIKVHPKFQNKLISFIENNKRLFFQRLNDSRVRDIHGDLYLKNVFVVGNRFYLYDRIEFNDALRYADVAEDVAHFAMDLDFHNKDKFRKYFISQYIIRSKDLKLEDVIYFLMCYKACVRAKVSLFRAEAVGKHSGGKHVKEGILHMKLAHSYLDLF